MSNSIRKLMAVLLCAALLFGAASLGSFAKMSPPFAPVAHAEVYPTSGTCGENLTWIYDVSAATLTISGTGAMSDYTMLSYNGTNVTTAPWQSYYNTMQTVVLNSGVTSIGQCAFYCCSGLTSLTIGNGVTSIGYAAFSYCTGLTSVTIPDNVTSIGNYAFGYCAGLTSVTIGNNVTSIGNGAFYDCRGLTSVTIPDSVTSIGGSAFENCTGMMSLTIGSGVKGISVHAFAGCTALTKINFNARSCVITIVSDVFADAGTAGDGIDVIFGSTVQKIPEWLFNAADCNYTVNVKTVIIPEGVTGISWQAFEGCTSLTSVTIPNSVKLIHNYAFAGCTGLTSLTIGNSVTNIGEGAFSDCTGLTSVTIPNSVKLIHNYAFAGCTGLTSLTIGNSVTSIGEGAFWSCTELTSVTIPNSVKKIGDSAFVNCAELESVTIPNSVTQIGDSAFANCAELESVTIPNSVTQIGDSAFCNCAKLTSARIGNGVTSIGNSTFSNCVRLSSVTIPDSVTSIGDNAFYDCTNISDIYYQGTLEQWNAITIGNNNQNLMLATLHTQGGHTHSYTSAVTKQPTCVETGARTYTCSCGDSYTEVIEKLPHTPKTVTVPATCTEPGKYYDVCEVCCEKLTDDTVLPATGHTYSQWMMFVDPTLTSEGLMGRKCTSCGVVLDQKTVPKLDGDHVTGLQLDKEKAYLNMGETLTLVAAVLPETALNKTVIWSSLNPEVAVVENGIVTPVAPGIAIITATAEDGGIRELCPVQVSAVAAQNGSFIENGTITGLSVNLNSLDDYLALADEGMTLSYSADAIGTGTKVLVMQGDMIVNEFEAVVFGDVDGDSWYDGTDAYFVQLVASGMVPASALTEAQRMAADCNHDGAIDASDVALLEQAGLLLNNIDQTTASEKLETNSAFLEYCGLINQNIEIIEPSADEPVEPEEPSAPEISDPSPAASSVWDWLQNLFRIVLNWLHSIFQIQTA